MPMRINYVLIDFENVQPASLALLEPEHFRVRVFVGASQAKLPFEMAQSMQLLGTRAEYVKIAGNGANALDFHLAFYLGQLACTEPKAYFHIVSKDAGFDPLVQHLRAKGILAARVRSLEDIVAIKTATITTAGDRAQLVIDRLCKPKVTRPRTTKTLGTSIGAQFLNQLSPEDVQAVIDAMQRLGVVTVDGTRVTYLLPEVE